MTRFFDVQSVAHKGTNIFIDSIKVDSQMVVNGLPNMHLPFYTRTGTFRSFVSRGVFV